MPAYPKDFLVEWSGDVDRTLCFGIMPFDTAFDPVWQTIRDVAEDDPFNTKCIRADDVARSGCIMEDVLEYIAKARLVVADLTGRNPNVFYELGIAHACKPSATVVLLSQSIDDVPFDLRHLRCHVYRSDLSDLPNLLSSVLAQSLQQRFFIEVKEGSRARFPARLTGSDRCLYELEVIADYLGHDGVKFRLARTRLVAGQDPEVGEPDDGHYIGRDHPDLDLPELGWKLHYGEQRGEGATMFLLREGD